MYMKPLPLLGGMHAQALFLKWLSLHHQGCLGAFPSNCTDSLFTFLLHLFTSLRGTSGRPWLGLGALVMKPGSLHWLDLLLLLLGSGEGFGGEGLPTSLPEGRLTAEDVKLRSVDSWNPEEATKSSRKQQ